MNISRGIKLLDEIQGTGIPAAKGDRVIYNLKIFLNHGEEVPLNETQAKQLPKEMIRIERGVTLIDHTTTLGKRQSIAAVEASLPGMKVGGYRKVRASPHLAFREKGLPGLIPGNAVLILELWLREIVAAD